MKNDVRLFIGPLLCNDSRRIRTIYTVFYQPLPLEQEHLKVSHSHQEYGKTKVIPFDFSFLVSQILNIQHLPRRALVPP